MCPKINVSFCLKKQELKKMHTIINVNITIKGLNLKL